MFWEKYSVQDLEALEDVELLRLFAQPGPQPPRRTRVNPLMDLGLEADSMPDLDALEDSGIVRLLLSRLRTRVGREEDLA